MIKREPFAATIRRAMTPKRRQQVWDACEGRCCGCDEPLTGGWIVDHILPLELGGADDLSNLQALCADPCNKSKCRFDAQRIAKMRRQAKMAEPKEPSRIKSRGFTGWRLFNGMQRRGKGLPANGRTGVKLRVLDLFSGIGGFSLGLERTGGFETVAFCEIEPFPRKVLAKHWPNVPLYEDVRTLTAKRLRADGIGVDVICGGFPCQDISAAGEKAGIDGERSGLWRELARLVGELRPCLLLVENVADLLRGPEEQPGAWFGRVLGDLATLGYDAEWHCIPAASVDAPHIRERVWLVAHPNGGCVREFGADSGDGGSVPAQGLERLIHRSNRGQGAVADADSFSLVGPAIARAKRHSWAAEPQVGRVVDGVPRRVVQPQLKSLGNAVVPQIPELIGRAILASRNPSDGAGYGSHVQLCSPGRNK